VARARNAAALEARGETLVFLDAHMNLREGWWEPLVELLAHPSVGAAQPCIESVCRGEARGYGERFRGPDLTLEWLPIRSQDPYPIPILCGCCFATRRDTFLKVGGLDGGMIGWGSEDCEFSLRLWRLGYEIWIDPGVVVGHLFRQRAPYWIDWSVVLHNRLRLAFAHFSAQRIERVVRSLRPLPHFHQAYAQIADSDVLFSRQWLSRNCLRDDDWFLKCSGKMF
jgi:GT2 family glycosyltransferase